MIQFYMARENNMQLLHGHDDQAKDRQAPSPVFCSVDAQSNQ